MSGQIPRRDDETHYRREAAREQAFERRQSALHAGLPRRMDIIRRVKAGELSWDETRRQIKSGFKPKE